MPSDRAAKPEDGSIDLSGLQSADEDQAMTLDDLSSAFAELLGQVPEAAGETIPSSPRTTLPVDLEEEATGDNEVTPRGILEAMLFVGNPDGSPLSATRVAALMRGVRAAEIEAFVAELNEHYAANRCPYRIVMEGAGYRMMLRGEYAEVQDVVRGRNRERRLTSSAIETLSIVAYRGPITAEAVSQLRGKPSSALLAQLVRRGLLRTERPLPAKPPRYVVTARFLEIAGLASLDDLPRAQDLDAK